MAGTARACRAGVPTQSPARGAPDPAPHSGAGSGRYQIRYPGPDARLRTGPEAFARASDARRALTLIEADMMAGGWADPDRGKVKLGDYAARWIAQRPGLRSRSVDLYRWLLRAVHRPSAWRGASREAFRAHDPRLAGRSSERWRFGINGGQVIPAASGGADNGGRGGQDLGAQPVSHLRRGGGARRRTAGADYGPGVRADRPCRPSSSGTSVSCQLVVTGCSSVATA